MAKLKTKEIKDISTEEKIKNAARIVFQRKGFAATRTRDIAEEAGINLALLNYYFRSKEKLFDIVILETLSHFLQTMVSVFNDESTSFEKKIELIAENYINFGIEYPDAPLFILDEIHKRHNEISYKSQVKQVIANSVFVRQFQENVMNGKIKEPNLMHFMINLMGLALYPVIAQSFITNIVGVDNALFVKLMEERKKLIPTWIKSMFFSS